MPLYAKNERNRLCLQMALMPDLAFVLFQHLLILAKTTFMKTICIFLLVIISSVAFGQSVEELDNKGGFKDFKVGEAIDTYKDKIKFTRTLENADTKLYLVKDRVSVKTYTGEVELKVYKEKVQEVIVSFKNSAKPDFEDILASLKTLYGEYQLVKKKTPAQEQFEKVYNWIGKKISLQVGYDENKKLTEMRFIDQKNGLNKLKDEF